MTPKEKQAEQDEMAYLLIKQIVNAEMKSCPLLPIVISLSKVGRAVLKEMRMPLYKNQEWITRQIERWWEHLPDNSHGNGKNVFGWNASLGHNMCREFIAIKPKPISFREYDAGFGLIMFNGREKETSRALAKCDFCGKAKQKGGYINLAWACKKCKESHEYTEQLEADEITE